ncbi:MULTISPECIES: S8 family peptidase [Legionella]|uniref:Subtilisin-like serine protease n=1 Tax=Legionella drozanskii LLAP-1 TaxID=1212489 RepID=A0A0W0SW43_9GAMM|nr:MULTISPECIES: S8 family serine peptidase [Legionella]KTC87491.1 subtilisin-like serine protease [Legionella drozanskii LLAP-1]PJE10475.1 MAG: protease [Legionella sp.]
MRKLFLSIFLFSFTAIVFGKALIDRDVLESIKKTEKLKLKEASAPTLSLIIFLHSFSEKKAFLDELSELPEVQIQELGFMPAVAITIPAEMKILSKIANYEAPAQVSSIKGGTKELEISTQALKLSPSSFYPDVKNWWAHGYTGSKGVIGLIDDGVDPNHPALANKKLVVHVERDPQNRDFYNGVRTAHGTGVACIYASTDKVYRGVAYGVSTIVSGLSGEETADPENIMMTLTTLDWMLGSAEIKPTIINYSMGNGNLACPFCPEWSGLAKVIDYVVNHGKILWVKSAGNAGYIAPTLMSSFASTLTVPGDNYNALTVANMNTLVTENGLTYKTADRSKHTIRSTSSRGPTPSGRRKPDLTAPGHDTRTCAPDPQVYSLHYSPAMDYRDGYRLMGGTSAAAPHVGASALLLQDAGIHNPMAIKALLINSADAWTDSGNPDPSNKNFPNGHFQVMGSEWNRTYGWGYLNMENAFEQRHDLIESQLTLEHPNQEYQTILDIGDKITLVHERRVGYFQDNTEWKLTHLSLELIDIDTKRLIALDDSPIDTVHQVANCSRAYGQKTCSTENKTIRALVRVKLLSPAIDGSDEEPFVLVLKRQNKTELAPVDK